MKVFAIFVFAVIALTLAKDPAEGWMGYATATSPSGGIITYIEAYWKVGADPRVGGAFYSPWFGIESSDNLNLIQPVNPWNGEYWSIYNEYFQWEPVHNENSRSHMVNAGDTLFGSVRYNPQEHSYTMVHVDKTIGWSVNTTIPIQKKSDGSYKKFTMAYFVMEKSQYNCDQYSPDGVVDFYNIKIEYDNQVVTPKWSTSFVDDNCNCRAHVRNSTNISITWDTR